MKCTRLFIPVLLLLLPVLAGAQNYASENASLQLTGSSYISIPYNATFNDDIVASGAISIDAWVRPTQSGQLMCIVGNDRHVSAYWFGLNAQRKLRFYANPTFYDESNSTIPLNTWTHVGVSYNASGNEMKFYINGRLDRQIKTKQSYLGYGYFDLRIGADRDNSGPTDYWIGGIDEVRIWRVEVDFSTAVGMLYRVPWAMGGGLHGRFMQEAWRLNGNARGAVNGHNGSNVGSVSYAQTPDPSHYDRMSLIVTNGPDRGDHVTIPSRSALNLTQNYTLECWVRPAPNGGSSLYQTFITKGSYNNNRWLYWLGLNKKNNRVRFVPNGDWQNALESSSTISLNTWTHVAARFEGSGSSHKAAIFINGLPAGTKSYSQTGSAIKEDVLIGSADIQSTGQTAFGFSGGIDEVRIWNTARSDHEIGDHHRMEFNGPRSGLVAAYRFHGDDLDRSGNNYHGTGSFRNSSQAYFADASGLPSPPSLTLVSPIGGERWQIGETEKNLWTASGLINVRIELSRDGGQTFSEVLAPSVPASGGSFDWQVTGPPTNNAVIRIHPPSASLPAVQSKAFVIEDPVPLMEVNPRQLIFTMYENGPAPDPRYIHLRNTGGKTLSWTATRGSAQWYDLTPSTGTGNEDSIRVEINNTQLPLGSYSDNVTIGGNAANAGVLVNIICNVVPAVSYEISGTVRDAFGAPAPGVRMVVVGTKNSEAFTDADGVYSISGLVPGDYSLAPSSAYYDFTPASRTFNGLSADQSGVDFTAEGLRGEIKVRYVEGWNLVSLPLPLSSANIADIFPDAVGSAYEYVPDEGYVEVEEMEIGKGYWIKFPSDDSVVVSGSYQTALDMTLQDEYGGWNLIGPPSGPVPLSMMESSPSDALVAIYGYHPDLGYVEPAGGMLRPGRGYFAKVSTEAVLQMIVQSFAPGAFPEFERVLLFPGAFVPPAPPPPPPTD